MPPLSRRAVLLGGAAAPLATPALAQAAAWPSRPIVMVCPLAAGSTPDILARIFAEQWSQRLGQPVTVENRPAANGTVALGQVARAAPDGHTVTVITETMVAFNPFLYPSIPYDPFRDFAYIARLAAVSNLLVVRAASRFRSVEELLAAARAAPGRLTYSSGGVGTTQHISAALLGQQARVEFQHVPYRGSPQGILAVQSGEVEFGFFNISTLVPGVRAGTLRPLAVTSVARSPVVPDVPTLRELGLPDFAMTSWAGLATVAGVPAPIVERMHEVTTASLADPATRRRMAELGFEELPPATPAEMLAIVRADHARWGPVIRATGERLE